MVDEGIEYANQVDTFNYPVYVGKCQDIFDALADELKDLPAKQKKLVPGEVGGLKGWDCR